jgi:hypothetical protein
MCEPLQAGLGYSPASDGFQAFRLMERIGRDVLALVSRSCHVRLHSSSLLHLLDDLPLRAGTTSSSLLQVLDAYCQGSNVREYKKVAKIFQPLKVVIFKPPCKRKSIEYLHTMAWFRQSKAGILHPDDHQIL